MFLTLVYYLRKPFGICRIVYSTCTYKSLYKAFHKLNKENNHKNYQKNVIFKNGPKNYSVLFPNLNTIMEEATLAPLKTITQENHQAQPSARQFLYQHHQVKLGNILAVIVACYIRAPTICILYKNEEIYIICL